MASKGPHVVAHHLNDMAVVASEDAVYVAPLATVEDVKDIVALLGNHKETAHLAMAHKTMHRSWGESETVLNSDRIHVERLFVDCGQALPAQTNEHRAEHWIVLRGMAELTVGDDTKILKEDHSAFAPAGTSHRLKNLGDGTLELISIELASPLDAGSTNKEDD